MQSDKKSYRRLPRPARTRPDGLHPSRTAFGTSSSVEKAIEFANKGGIVTFCWHWNAPTEYLNSTANNSTAVGRIHTRAAN
ncbi:MAG: glycosyl hydrolase [[Eubacterium] siraeum]